MIPKLLCAMAFVVAVPAWAQAQTVRCSAFLLEHDGSWRSFEPGAILGPDGDLIDVHTGQRFRRGRPSGSDFIARVLDAQCRP